MKMQSKNGRRLARGANDSMQGVEDNPQSAATRPFVRRVHTTMSSAVATGS